MNAYVLVFGAIFLVSLLVPALLYLLRYGCLRCGRAVRHVSSTTFSLFASLYAFFLGFCLVTLWNDFSTARTVVANEASAMLAAQYFSTQFQNAGAFRDALTAYAQSVVDEEWPDMDGKLAMSDHSHRLAVRVWEAYRAMAPQDKHDNILYANLGNVLLDASRQRNARALLLSGNIYPPVWVVIDRTFATVAASLLPLRDTVSFFSNSAPLDIFYTAARRFSTIFRPVALGNAGAKGHPGKKYFP